MQPEPLDRKTGLYYDKSIIIGRTSDFRGDRRRTTGKGVLFMKSKVFFTKEITPEKVVALYHAVGLELPGKVAVKVHSGERAIRTF